VQYFWERSERRLAASLTYQGFTTGWRIGELEIALRIAQQKEALCLERGNKGGLHRSYGNQALILKAWGRLARGGFRAAQERGSALPGARE
jgi:hypothetical protein